MRKKTPLPYRRYCYNHSFQKLINNYSAAHMRYPHALRNRVCLRDQYWYKNLGLRRFAHYQLHKGKRFGRHQQWFKLGLNDTKVREKN